MIEAVAWVSVSVAATGAALHLAAPVATPRGPERRAVALAKRAERRLVDRAHPQAPYPDPDAGEAADG